MCSQLHRAQALSGCDTVSYPFDIGKASVLKTPIAGNLFTKKEEMDENDEQHDHDYDYDYVDRDESYEKC